MPPKAKKLLEGSNERTDTFYGAQLGRSKDVLEWPYKTPSPEFMGKSGFYFTPTKKLTDRVTCYYCKATQCNWKDVKDPTSYHLEHHKDCSFSKLLHLSKERSSNPEFDWSKVREFNDPLSKEAIAIRQKTFGENWAHDKVAGSNATSKNMVNAGFYYSPMDTGDDLAICVYCGVSLEGWEYEDDPLFEHQKRSKGCYFLEHLKKGDEPKKSSKRSSFVAITEENSEKIDTKSRDDGEITKCSGRSLRPHRKRKVFKELSSDEDEDNDESFGLTANEDELSEEPYVEDSKTRASNTAINKESSQTKKDSLSPLKKSKFLDSSFEHDMFSDNQIQKLELPVISRLLSVSPKKRATSESAERDFKETNDENRSSQSISKKRSPSPVRSALKPALGDITNISRQQSNSPKKPAMVEYETSDEENSIILISNSKEYIEQDLTRKEESKTSAKEEQSSTVTNKEPGPLKQILDEQSSQGNHKEAKPFQEDLQNLTHSFNNENCKSGNTTINKEEKNTEQDSNIQNSGTEAKSSSKTILQSISRLFESPQIQRSRSPFLDNTFQDASDQIGVKEAILSVNDTPIEESTEHHIVLEKEAKEASVEPLEKEVKDSILEDLDKSQRYENSEDEDDLESNYQSIENDNINYWMPTDTDKLFRKIESQENTKSYLQELKDLDFELNDDIDGRVSYFINEMPDNELEMTISDWIKHSAKLGRKHLKDTCMTILEQFDEESERASKKLKELPTE